MFRRKHVIALLFCLILAAVSCHARSRLPSQQQMVNQPTGNARVDAFMAAQMQYVREHGDEYYIHVGNTLFNTVQQCVSLDLVENGYQPSTSAGLTECGIIRFELGSAWRVSWTYDTDGFLQTELLKEGSDYQWSALQSEKDERQWIQPWKSEYELSPVSVQVSFQEWWRIRILMNAIQGYLEDIAYWRQDDSIDDESEARALLTEPESIWGVRFEPGLDAPVSVSFSLDPIDRMLTLKTYYKGIQVDLMQVQLRLGIAHNVGTDPITGVVEWK